MECHFTTGPYTMLTKLYSRDNEHLMDLLNSKIQEIPGVTATETLISLEQSIKKKYPFKAKKEWNGWMNTIRRYCHRHLYLFNNRSFPPHRGQGRILLGYTVLVDIFGTGHSRHYRDCAYQWHPDFLFIGCLLLLFFLDYQGDIRATRTRAERLVSDESETETRIRIETILSGQTLCNPIKGFLFLLQEAL